MNLNARLPSPLRRALALALLAGGVALAASSETLHGLLLSLIASAEGIVRDRPVLGVIVFVALAAMSAMLAFVSSAVIAPVAILVWGKAISVVLLWSGWILGGVVSYLFGRYLGRPVISRLIHSRHLDRYEAALSEHASFPFVLLFQFALPSEVPGGLLGLARYPLAKYLLVLLIAELPYAIGVIYLGESFLRRQTMLLIALGALAVAVSVAALYWLHARISRTPSPEQDG